MAQQPVRRTHRARYVTSVLGEVRTTWTRLCQAEVKYEALKRAVKGTADDSASARHAAKTDPGLKDLEDEINYCMRRIGALTGIVVAETAWYREQMEEEERAIRSKHQAALEQD